MPANFTRWEIDSIDNDPVYWSPEETRRNCTGRWCYVTEIGSNVPSVPDTPSIGMNCRACMKFKMCLFRVRDVPVDGPSITEPESLLNRAITCIDWEFKAIYEEGKTPEEENIDPECVANAKSSK